MIAHPECCLWLKPVLRIRIRSDPHYFYWILIWSCTIPIQICIFFRWIRIRIHIFQRRIRNTGWNKDENIKDRMQQCNRETGTDLISSRKCVLCIVKIRDLLKQIRQIYWSLNCETEAQNIFCDFTFVFISKKILYTLTWLWWEFEK